jgi:hypothetical protein
VILVSLRDHRATLRLFLSVPDCWDGDRPVHGIDDELIELLPSLPAWLEARGFRNIGRNAPLAQTLFAEPDAELVPTPPEYMIPIPEAERPRHAHTAIPEIIPEIESLG